MQSEVPSPNFIWGVLASRFQSELKLQKSRIWRLSGFREEYGGPAEGDPYRERELKTLIEEIAGSLVQAAALEAEDRQFANISRERVGRPPDVITPFLAPALLSLFGRCHGRAGRQSVVIATTTDGKFKQGEAGELFLFIDTIIRPLNQYLTTELGRTPLSASRLARFALENRRRVVQALTRCEAKPAAKEVAVDPKRELPPFVRALQSAFAMSEKYTP
jgi:hypothetical protein